MITCPPILARFLLKLTIVVVFEESTLGHLSYTSLVSSQTVNLVSPATARSSSAVRRGCGAYRDGWFQSIDNVLIHGTEPQLQRERDNPTPIRTQLQHNEPHMICTQQADLRRRRSNCAARTCKVSSKATPTRNHTHIMTAFH